MIWRASSLICWISQWCVKPNHQTLPPINASRTRPEGEGSEDFILPESERPPQFGEFIAEPLDLELDLGVATSPSFATGGD